jgi:hypothetical protein
MPRSESSLAPLPLTGVRSIASVLPSSPARLGGSQDLTVGHIDDGADVCGFPVVKGRDLPDAPTPPMLEHGAMTYAVIWSANDEPDRTGGLELTEEEIKLSGADATRALRYEDLSSLHIERSAPARHPWEPTLVLVTRKGDRVAVGSLEGPGALHELAERVAATGTRGAA